MREFGKLTALQVKRAKRRGMLNDGGGLYLRVAEGGSKSSIFRFKRDGLSRDMGLGSLIDVSLSEAREKALEGRKMLHDGNDPIMARRTARAIARAIKTFKFCATE